jgi:hypothetical protein
VSDAVPTRQFRKLKVQYNEPVGGIDMWIAVWRNEGNNVLIGAPDLERLRSRWKEITGETLFDSFAQHVIVTKFNAPEELYRQALAVVDSTAEGK